MHFDLDLIETLLVAIAVLYAGSLLKRVVAPLEQFNIPVPVVGGILFAVVTTALFLGFDVEISFDMDLRGPLMLAFFTTIGLGADLRLLLRGGPKLGLFLLAAALFLVAQNAVGIGAALLLDLHPLVGLLSSSITLSGGHGTGAAYAERFAEVQNLQGALELAMACATFGLVIGGLIGGPLAQWLIASRGLAPAAAPDEPQGPAEAAGDETPVSASDFLWTLFVIALCLTLGASLASLAAGGAFTLPAFIWALLIGVLIRNLGQATGLLRLHRPSVDLLGSVSLSLFLAMSLMALRLWELASLAGPLLAVLAAQTATMMLFAGVVTFRLMGGDYDAAVICGGHCGFGMGATPTAVANMEAVTRRYGASPTAYIVIPLTGAFFIDIANALVLAGYLSLPLFGFP